MFVFCCAKRIEKGICYLFARLVGWTSQQPETSTVDKRKASRRKWNSTHSSWSTYVLHANRLEVKKFARIAFWLGNVSFGSSAGVMATVYSARRIRIWLILKPAQLEQSSKNVFCLHAQCNRICIVRITVQFKRNVHMYRQAPDSN